MKQLNIRIDDATYAELEKRAAGAHMTPADYARALLADDVNEQRNRFLAYAAHFSEQWGPYFEAEYGPYPKKAGNNGTEAA
ncbi:hypothetical protein NLX86_29305 [Streptomyces sp. A3M-1-3]|uniref:hypothetical protein n=1 Tax=Streptomyces sp. A3M-1-3 TaxID=2962044 RepID=UPI0020B68C3E|nr:hypothetical protein [Streptomyces sp. A3M-1-3]MCP3822034.1 hypothetical protein [Streptomyces sp. A3M-1-3]